MDQQMSYFLPPITNTLPTGNCTLREVYRWITEDKSLETVTNELRAFIREGRVAEYRQLKQRQLPFVTPHGVFSRRKSDALISASGLVVVDIDHLASLEEAEQLRDHLFEDPYLGTRLAFVSPGGLGVKLFIPGDETVRWAMVTYSSCMPTPSRVRWIPVARISPVAVSCLTILTLKYSYHEQRSFQTSRSGTGGPCRHRPHLRRVCTIGFRHRHRLRRGRT